MLQANKLNTNSYKPHWVREDFVDFMLSKVNPLWTLRRTMARIEAIQPIADDMIKVTLSSSRKFNGYQPGQFVMLTVRIDGVQHQRAYSLVSSPQDGKLVLGIKKQGRVSNYLANTARVGDVIEITQAMGEFTLKDHDHPVLLISAGSGITPIIPIAKQALERTKLPVTLIYYSRDPAFREELENLAAQYPHFNLNIIVDSADKPAFFDEDTLDRLCVDAKYRETYVCAAPGLMKATREIWAKRGWSDKLTQESFLPVAVSADAQAIPVNFRRSMQEFEGRGNLLASAEAAGLKPSLIRMPAILPYPKRFAASA
ncbi:MAG: ferredoxin reductase [Moraxellaceae bacterium]|nr:MAG: ferredoxin reductase [Moraxellaceae bacterium]